MPASSTMISWFGLIVSDVSMTRWAAMCMRANNRSNGLDALRNRCWSMPSRWMEAMIRSGLLMVRSFAMVMLSHPMLPFNSPTAFLLVASPMTLPEPYRACHAWATAFMVVVLPVPAGPMMLLTRRGFSNTYAAAFC